MAADERAAALAEMARGTVDLLVIGGGITGAGVAREAAGRGLRVALVEREDFACGTSSRSTKLVHGGLRYLKSGDLRLVHEAVVERQRLLAMAPHLVQAARFAFPVYRGDPDPLWKLRLGLTLYDWFAGRRNPHRHRICGPAELLAVEPLLRREDLTGGALYSDATTDDARLTVAVLTAARRGGALAANYAEVVGFLKDGAGRVTGARLQDRLGGVTLTVAARAVLNASGPWLDMVRRLDDPGAPAVLRPTRGVHVAVLHGRLPLRQPVVLRGRDRRLMFAVPTGPCTYLGTTDTDYGGDPAEPPVEWADVAYILDAANRAFPACRLGPEDVISTWSGLRPLLNPGDSRRPTDVSRDYRLFHSPSGLVSVGGGKLTTFRAMASAIVDRLAPGSRRAAGAGALDPLPGGEGIPGAREVAAAAAAAGLPVELAADLAARHGALYTEVLGQVRPEDHGLPVRVLRVRLETRHGVKRELARRLTDVLVRRTPEALFSPDNGREVAPAAAAEMAALLGWSREREAEELREYLAFVEQLHTWRTQVLQG